MTWQHHTPSSVPALVCCYAPHQYQSDRISASRYAPLEYQRGYAATEGVQHATTIMSFSSHSPARAHAPGENVSCDSSRSSRSAFVGA
eukprot:2290286-Rhodomonas_salina.4